MYYPYDLFSHSQMDTMNYNNLYYGWSNYTYSPQEPMKPDFSIINLVYFQRYKDETNDNGRFFRAIRSVSKGSILIIPSGCYEADTIIINKPIHMIGLGHVEIRSTKINKDIIIVHGAKSDVHYKLDKPVSRGERSVILTTTPTDMTIGDMVVLTDDTVRFSDKQSDVNTEVHEIEAFHNQEVFFTDRIYLEKTPAPSGKNLYKVKPLDNVLIKNIKVNLTEGSKKGRGIYAQYVRYLKIENFSGNRMAGSLVQVRKGMYISVEKFSNNSPQVVGSGQGYGIQFYGGNNHILIRDGITKYCRHSVDLDGTFDVLVENVVDINSQGASFCLSHNGWTTDITFKSCRALNTKGTGFVVSSQGHDLHGKYTHSQLYELYNFQIIGCEVQHKEGTGHLGINFSIPVKNVIVSGCRLRYGTGNSIVPRSAGIVMFPANNSVLIENCVIEGYDYTLGMITDTDYINKSLANKIIFKNIQITNSNSITGINRGQLRCIQFYNINCNKIHKTLFEIGPIGSFHEFTIDGLSITESDSVTMFNTTPTGYKNKPILGVIRHIQTDLLKPLSPSSGWRIINDQLYLNSMGSSIMLTGRASSSAVDGKVFPDGIVEGQRLTILSSSQKGSWTLYSGDNIIFSNNTTTLTLGKGCNAKHSVTFEWRKLYTKGYWYQTQ